MDNTPSWDFDLRRPEPPTRKPRDLLKCPMCQTRMAEMSNSTVHFNGELIGSYCDGCVQKINEQHNAQMHRISDELLYAAENFKREIEGREPLSITRPWITTSKPTSEGT